MTAFDAVWNLLKSNPNWNRKLIEEELHGARAIKPTEGNCPVCYGFFNKELPDPEACICDRCSKCGLDMASTKANQCRCEQ